MVAYINMAVSIGSFTEKAAELTFHEGTPDEVELWVPLSLIDNPEVLSESSTGDANVSVAKWFLKKNDVPYDGFEDDSDDGFEE